MFNILVEIVLTFSEGYFGFAMTEEVIRDDVNFPVTMPVITSPSSIHITIKTRPRFVLGYLSP